MAFAGLKKQINKANQVSTATCFFHHPVGAFYGCVWKWMHHHDLHNSLLLPFPFVTVYLSKSWKCSDILRNRSWSWQMSVCVLHRKRIINNPSCIELLSYIPLLIKILDYFLSPWNYFIVCHWKDGRRRRHQAWLGLYGNGACKKNF